jgi:hypothetical protein
VWFQEPVMRHLRASLTGVEVFAGASESDFELLI